MINKKILAAAVAAACTFNAHAVIDLTKSAGALKYATQNISNGETITGNVALNFTVPVGLNLPTISIGSEFFIRIQLTNAKWGTNVVETGDLTISTASTGNNAAAAAASKPITVAGGGALTDSYVTFKYSNDSLVDLTKAADVLTFDFTQGNDTGLVVTDVTKAVTVSYKLYQNKDSLDALNGTGSEEVASTSLDAYTFVSGQNIAGSFVASNLTALVSSQFKKYTANSTESPLGKVQMAVVTGVLAKANSAQVSVADVYTTPTTTATLTGDFSFGTFNLSASATCADTGTTVVVPAAPAAQTTATIVATDYTTARYLCSKVDGLTGSQVIPKVSSGHVVTLAGNVGLVGSLGTISYDTTSIAVPYLTTFENYNQRIYLTNTSATDASYTTTFRAEEGTTATGGTAATGVVKAGQMLAIKATDLVTIIGNTTRASATIEIEAQDSSVLATSQTVRKTTGETDTVSLFGELNVLTSSLAAARTTASENAAALVTANASIVSGNNAVAVTTAATSDLASAAANQAAAIAVEATNAAASDIICGLNATNGVAVTATLIKYKASTNACVINAQDD
jgi:hypothetical protein